MKFGVREIIFVALMLALLAGTYIFVFSKTTAKRAAMQKDIAEWDKILRPRYLRQNRELKIDSKHAYEFFTVSAWGEIPDYDKLLADFPAIKKKHSYSPLFCSSRSFSNVPT